MKLLMKILSLAVILSLCASIGYGQIIPPDIYIGGNPTYASYVGKDVIGNPESDFEITGGRAWVTGDSITVNIYAQSYFNNILTQTTNLGGSPLYGTEMGDLFISIDGLAWTTQEETKTDFFKSSGSTVWEYGISLGTYDNEGGTKLTSGGLEDGDLYVLDSGDMDNEIALSNAGGIYRADQEVQIVTANTALATGGTDAASWFIDSEKLSITIDNFDDLLGGLDLNNLDLGFHWAMTCANDVIEFDYATTNPVPEPHTVGLLGAAGMLGIILVRRRLRK